MIEEGGTVEPEKLQRWNYETHFREYMLRLGAKGQEALISINDFPERISLNYVWHGVLYQMRRDTKQDGIERHMLIEYGENARDISFPENPTKGRRGCVPSRVIDDSITRAVAERGATSIIGCIHTHQTRSSFAPDDLLPLLSKYRKRTGLICGLANSRENVFAFRTKETVPIQELDDPSAGEFEKLFIDYWTKRAGFKDINKDTSKYGGHDLYPISLFPNVWKISYGIAETYRLALYKGKPGNDLVRLQTNRDPKGGWADIILSDLLDG